MKTCCGVEALQFTTVERLRPVLALLSVVAVHLLQLRDAGRQADAAVRPATDVFPDAYVNLLGAGRFGSSRPLTGNRSRAES